jgi:O-antigen/teichoic acid export membrane protein
LLSHTLGCDERPESPGPLYPFALPAAGGVPRDICLKPFEASGAFPKINYGNHLRGVAIRGAGITLLAQASTYLVQLVGVTILARILVPSDFGLVTVVTTVSIFLAGISQSGFPEAILQREEFNRYVASNAFWITFGIAAAMTLGFAATGPLLARLYGDPRIARVTVVVSLSILLTGAAVVHLALLDRGMRFSAGAANTIVSRLASVGVSVLMARAGWGYWALVGGVIAQPLAALIGAWSLCQWIPSLPRATEGTRSLFSFAVNVNAMGNISYWTRNMDNVLVGWRFGSGPLGFYKKAYDLFALPANQFVSVFPVAVSTLSRLTRDPAQYRRYFLAGLSSLALVGMAAAGSLTLVGRDVVRLILGPHWGPAGWIFTCFAPGIGFLLIYRASAVIHLSIGTPGRLLRWTIVEFVVTVFLFLLGLHWGPMGVAVAWTASFCILIIPGFRYAGKPIDLEVTSVIATTWRFLAASLLAGFVCALIIRQFPSFAGLPDPAGAVIRIIATSSAFLIFYLGGVILLHQGRAPLLQFADVLREMISVIKPSVQPLGEETVKADAAALKRNVP